MLVKSSTSNNRRLSFHRLWSSFHDHSLFCVTNLHPPHVHPYSDYDSGTLQPVSPLTVARIKSKCSFLTLFSSGLDWVHPPHFTTLLDAKPSLHSTCINHRRNNRRNLLYWDCYWTGLCGLEVKRPGQYQIHS
jgi:hypothetical protein